MHDLAKKKASGPMWLKNFLYTIHDPSNKEEGLKHFTEVKSSTPIQKPSGLHPP
jgi:hypothetical protein